MKPVIVITRHPDYETEVETYGLPEDTQIIVLDLGAGFDIGSPRDADKADAGEWVDGMEDEVAGLPEDHPARAAVQEVIDQVREAFDLIAGEEEAS